jgi:hypothetical protein
MAHPDLDQLLNVVLEFAKKMLNQHGEFYPFGASMHTDGTSAWTARRAAAKDLRPRNSSIS